MKHEVSDFGKSSFFAEWIQEIMGHKEGSGKSKMTILVKSFVVKGRRGEIVAGGRSVIKR